MVAFIAGDVVSASALRDALGAAAVLQSDVTVAANTAQQDCPGLAVSVDAYSRYIIEGYLAYTTGVTPEIRFGLTAPPEAAGTWLPSDAPTALATYLPLAVTLPSTVPAGRLVAPRLVIRGIAISCVNTGAAVATTAAAPAAPAAK